MNKWTTLALCLIVYNTYGQIVKKTVTGSLYWLDNAIMVIENKEVKPNRKLSIDLYDLQLNKVNSYNSDIDPSYLSCFPSFADDEYAVTMGRKGSKGGTILILDLDLKEVSSRPWTKEDYQRMRDAKSTMNLKEYYPAMHRTMQDFLNYRFSTIESGTRMMEFRRELPPTLPEAEGTPMLSVGKYIQHNKKNEIVGFTRNSHSGYTDSYSYQWTVELNLADNELISDYCWIGSTDKVGYLQYTISQHAFGLRKVTDEFPTEHLMAIDFENGNKVFDVQLKLSNKSLRPLFSNSHLDVNSNRIILAGNYSDDRIGPRHKLVTPFDMHGYFVLALDAREGNNDGESIVEFNFPLEGREKWDARNVFLDIEDIDQNENGGYNVIGKYYNYVSQSREITPSGTAYHAKVEVQYFSTYYFGYAFSSHTASLKLEKSSFVETMRMSKDGLSLTREADCRGMYTTQGRLFPAIQMALHQKDELSIHAINTTEAATGRAMYYVEPYYIGVNFLNNSAPLSKLTSVSHNAGDMDMIPRIVRVNSGAALISIESKDKITMYREPF